MAKKKQKIKRTKKELPPKVLQEDEKWKDAIEISQTVTDVKSFIEKFRADVGKRRQGYRSFARKFQEKKP